MKLTPYINKFVTVLILCFLLFNGCKKDNLSSNIQYLYKVPEQTTDGWDVASLSDVGMNETPMNQFMDELLNNLEHKIHGILIIKEGKLVFEEYFPGYAFYHGPLTNFNLDMKHNQASVTKTFTSAIIGIVIDKGFIQDVDQKIFSFFPEYADLSNAEKDNVTLEHLLTMTAGLEWDESTYPYSDYRNDIYQVFHQSDPIHYILNKPMDTVPGTQFLYNGGCTNILGEIVRKSTGLRADEFADEYLFSPLGITDYEWQELPNDVLYTSGDLKLRPRDMAKLGDMYLHNGSWKGQQIIPAWWIEESTKPYISATPDWENWDYGYKWWLYTYEFNSNQIELFSARGWGGQNIMVLPSLDMVVVTTAGYYDEPELEFHIGVLLMQKILASAL